MITTFTATKRQSPLKMFDMSKTHYIISCAIQKDGYVIIEWLQVDESGIYDYGNYSTTPEAKNATILNKENVEIFLKNISEICWNESDIAIHPLFIHPKMGDEVSASDFKTQN